MKDDRSTLCPICRKPSARSRVGEVSLFPFCSDRCKLIDLGRWLDEKYQIQVEQQSETDTNDNSPRPGRGLA